MRYLWTLAILTTSFLACFSQKSLPHCGRTVCSVWAYLFKVPAPFSFSIKDIDVSLCSHTILMDAILNGNKITTPFWKDDKEKDGIYDQLIKLKERNKNLKNLLSIDLYRDRLEFSKMASTAAGRKEVISTLVPFLRDRAFDGVTLVWYPPRAEDKDILTTLFKEISEEFEKESKSSERKKLLFAADVPKTRIIIDRRYNVKALASYVDMINVETYNFNGYKNMTLGHNSPLTTNDVSNVEESVKYWVELGMPADKINIYIAAYGRRGYTSSANDMTIGQSVLIGLAPPGDYTNVTGAYAYYELCSILKQGVVHWDSAAHVPYHIQDNYFMTYDNEQSVAEKVRFVRENHYGGVALWAMNTDDFKGTECGNGKFPLMRTVKNECDNRWVGHTNSGAPHSKNFQVDFDDY